MSSSTLMTDTSDSFSAGSKAGQRLAFKTIEIRPSTSSNDSICMISVIHLTGWTIEHDSRLVGTL